MIKPLVSTVCIVLLLVMLSGAAMSQDGVIRIDSNLVIVPTAVLDRDGRYITDLKKDEFKVLENGTEQEIAFFESSDQPVTVYFLVDVSSSMAAYQENLNIAALQMAKRLRPQDRLKVISYFQYSETVIGSTEVGKIVKWPTFKTLNAPDCPSTYTYNAVDKALNDITKIPGRKAIMLFTDGVGDGFGVSAKDNYRKALESGVLIYTFKFGTHEPDPMPHTVSKKIYTERIDKIYEYMNGLATKSGGRSYQIESITNIGATFGEVTNELSRQYRLGYYPKNDAMPGTTHDLRVKVNRADVAVRSKTSYTTAKRK